MGQAQINVRTRACSGTFIARTKQAALTHNVRGKRLIIHLETLFITAFFLAIYSLSTLAEATYCMLSCSLESLMCDRLATRLGLG